MVSIRHSFWNAATLAEQPAWAQVVQDSFQTTLFTPQEIETYCSRLQSKRVLLLVHGFNDNEKQTIDSYFHILENIQKKVLDAQTAQCFYDAVIGFVWPGYAHGFDYFFAKKNAAAASPFLRQLLTQLSATTPQIDVLCHSMGNLLLLDALEHADIVTAPLIGTFFSVAPAVNDHAIDDHHHFFPSTQHVKELVVLHSHRDPVEKWIFRFAEHKRALGEEGDGRPLKLPPNVQMLDCSALVNSHSGYFSRPEIYEWMRKRKNREIDGPETVQDFQFLPDGTLSITRRRTPEMEGVS